MPILPSGVCGAWSGHASTTNSGFEVAPAGKRLFSKPERDCGAVPAASKDADSSRHRRQYESKDGIGSWDSWVNRECGNPHFMPLSKSRSEASLAASEESKKMPSAGCPHQKIGERRDDYCPHRLGKHKGRGSGVQVGTTSQTNDARLAHGFRFYMDPNEKRVGKQTARSDDSVPSQKEKSCAEHRYYCAPDADRITGLRQRTTNSGQEAHGHGVNQALHSYAESTATSASTPRARQRSLPPRLHSSPSESDLSCSQQVSGTPRSLSRISANADKNTRARKPSSATSAVSADSASTPRSGSSFKPRPRQRSAPIRSSRSSTVSDASQLSSSQVQSVMSSSLSGFESRQGGTRSARGTRQKSAESLVSESTRDSQSEQSSYESVSSSQVQLLRDRMKDRARMYRECSERDSLASASSECSSVTARWNM